MMHRLGSEEKTDNRPFWPPLWARIPTTAADTIFAIEMESLDLELLPSYTNNSCPPERRPPIYNAEDYVFGLKKLCKLTGLQLYLDTSAANEYHHHNNNNSENVRKNNDLNSLGLEMGLKQFSTITDLLVKLKDDLTLSFPSFIREFIGAPNDGVNHLLDALKAIQLAQTNITGR